MTTKVEFFENRDGAPLSLDELAESALKVIDNDELRNRAEQFLFVRDAFVKALADVGTKQG